MRPVIFDCLWGGEGEDFGKITWFSVGTEETLNVSRRQQSMKGGRGGEGAIENWLSVHCQWREDKTRVQSLMGGSRDFYCDTTKFL